MSAAAVLQTRRAAVFSGGPKHPGSFDTVNVQKVSYIQGLGFCRKRCAGAPRQRHLDRQCSMRAKEDTYPEPRARCQESVSSLPTVEVGCTHEMLASTEGGLRRTGCQSTRRGEGEEGEQGKEGIKEEQTMKTNPCRGSRRLAGMAQRTRHDQSCHCIRWPVIYTTGWLQEAITEDDRSRTRARLSHYSGRMMG